MCWVFQVLVRLFFALCTGISKDYHIQIFTKEGKIPEENVKMQNFIDDYK